MNAFVVLAVLLHCVMGDTSTEVITEASNEFSNKLYEKISPNPGNVLVCPISLHVALGLLLEGAGGDTAAQLASVLRLDNTNNNIKEGYKSLLTGVKDNALKIATKLYPAAGYQLNNDYINVVKHYFMSDVEGIDYSNANAAAQKINNYVEEKTNNKIHNLISPDSISDLTKMIIINAVYFQATWKLPFTTAYDDYFLVSKQEKVLTKMMSQTDNFHYKEDKNLDAKILKMDYNEGDYSMLFILPNKDDGLADVEAKLVNMNLESILRGLRQTRVEVTIPKFTIEQTLDLKDTLIKMGAKDMFSSRANLRNIGTGDSLYVSDVIQKTFINVHENGTEAAAATAFIETLSAPSADDLVFRARIPFHFYLIKNKPSSVILFHGRFVKPVAKSPSEGTKTTEESEIRFSEGSAEDNKKQQANEQTVPTTNDKNNPEAQNYNSNLPIQNNGQFHQPVLQQPNSNGGLSNSFQEGSIPVQQIQAHRGQQVPNIYPTVYRPNQNQQQFYNFRPEYSQPFGGQQPSQLHYQRQNYNYQLQPTQPQQRY